MLLVWTVAVVTPTEARSNIHGLVLYTTNYIVGGYSKSNDHGVVQVNIDYEPVPNLYTGVWVSPVDFADRQFSRRAHVEFAPYVGWGQSRGHWRVDSTATYYLYDDRVFGRTSHYASLGVSLRYREAVTVHVAYKPDYFGRGKAAFDYRMGARTLFTDRLELTGGLGYSDVSRTLEYNYLYGDVGVSYFIGATAVGLRYTAARELHETVHTSPTRLEPNQLLSKLVLSVSYGF